MVAETVEVTIKIMLIMSKILVSIWYTYCTCIASATAPMTPHS